MEEEYLISSGIAIEKSTHLTDFQRLFNYRHGNSYLLAQIEVFLMIYAQYDIFHHFLHKQNFKDS